MEKTLEKGVKKTIIDIMNQSKNNNQNKIWYH